MVELGVWTRYSLLILAELRPEVLLLDLLPLDLVYLPEMQANNNQIIPVYRKYSCSLEQQRKKQQTGLKPDKAFSETEVLCLGVVILLRAQSTHDGLGKCCV